MISEEEKKRRETLLKRKNFAKAAKDPVFMKRLIKAVTGYDVDIKSVDIICKDGKENSIPPTPDVIVHTLQGTRIEIVLPESISREYLERKGMRKKEDKD